MNNIEQKLNNTEPKIKQNINQFNVHSNNRVECNSHLTGGLKMNG